MTAWLAALLVGVASVAALGLQARRARRRARRLPEAAGPADGSVAGRGPPIRLLILGDSTVAGVGAPSHEAGLAGGIADELGRLTNRAIRWRARGRSGYATRDVRDALLPSIGEPADVVVIAVGVNDTTRLHSPLRFSRDLLRLVTAVRARSGNVPVVLAGVPPMGRFPALPQPLRSVLGVWAYVLDRAAQRVARRLPAVAYVRTVVRDGLDFAPDGYHPGPRGYAAWGAALARAAAAQVEWEDGRAPSA